MVFLCQIGFKNEPGLTSKSNQKPNQKIRIQCTTVYTKVEADIDVFWFDFDVKPGSFLKPIWHQKTIGFWYGFGMVLVWFWFGSEPNQNHTKRISLRTYTHTGDEYDGIICYFLH